MESNNPTNDNMSDNAGLPLLEYQLVAKPHARIVTRDEALLTTETACAICTEDVSLNADDTTEIARVSHCECNVTITANV